VPHQVYRGSNAGLFLWVRLEDTGAALMTCAMTDGSRLRRGNKPMPSEVKRRQRIPNVLVGETVLKLMAEKVLVSSGEEFCAEERGWFRIVFSHVETYLMEGLKRIVHALDVYEE